MNAKTKKQHPQNQKPAPPRRPRKFAWLLSWFAIALFLVLISAIWHLPTRIRLELATGRLALTLGGSESREILNPSVAFSSLVIEDCNTVTFNAKKLEVADPTQLVPATKAGETSHFPDAAWHEIAVTDPVTLECRDPAAKVMLESPDPTSGPLGTLDRIRLEPGSQVILETSSKTEPTLSLEIETPQDLHLALGPKLLFVAAFTHPEGIALPFEGEPLTYRAQLPEAHRSLQLTSRDRGLVLIVTPPPDQLDKIFREPLDLPLASVELLEENTEGAFETSLRAKATLTYPDYPDLPTVTIERDEVISLSKLSKTKLRRLELEPENEALSVFLDGIVDHAATRAGDFEVDHRRTLLEYLWYNPRARLIATVVASLITLALVVKQLLD